MKAHIHKLSIQPPKYVIDNLCYETIMGSEAYGVQQDKSDRDIYGFCMPDLEILFPALRGEIEAFRVVAPRFEQFQQHHIEFNNYSYDVSIYNIAKYFRLCMDNNPNMIDSLFTNSNHVTYSNNVGKMVKENRHLFLHKGSWHKFKGYAYSQLNKLKTKNPDPTSKRYESIQQHGYDVKFAYHVVRLILEVEQILIEHDLDLTRNSQQLINVRNGNWTLEELVSWFKTKELSLEEVYTKSTLRHRPDVDAITKLLYNCIEEHYGDMSFLK